MTRAAVGAFTNLPSQNAAGASAYARAFPGARTFRAFSGGVPVSIARTEADGFYAAGLVPFLSCKSSYTAIGADDAAIAQLAASMTGGGQLTDWHEPENDMTAAQYVAVTRNFYEKAKPANPLVDVCDVAMAYQWDPGHAVPTPHAWDSGNDHCDARGIDIYSEKWRTSTATPVPIDKLPGLQRWLGWAGPLGKPLMAAELGCSVMFADAARADWYAHAFDWLSQNGFVLVLPWNGNGTPGTEQFYYWGGPTPFPLTADVIRKATAPVTPVPVPVPVPVNPTPWAYPISPDPTDRIKALQAALGLTADGLLGNGTLTAVEKAIADLGAARASIANAMHDLGASG